LPLQRAQGSFTKSQLRHNNGTDEHEFGCYANGQRAHVTGGTIPGARHGLVAIIDYLKKRARYLLLVAENNKAVGVNVTPITVVDSIDPEILENLIDMEEIDAESVEDCTDESVMNFLESTQELTHLLQPSSSRPKCCRKHRSPCRRRILLCAS
jgi:hypothetical protein